MRDFEYPGRSTAYATTAMAATSHPLATATALDVLRGGGNAIDAALAAAAVLAVVEPHMTGIGGDCFVLYCPKGGDAVIAYNGSGRAPAATTLAYFTDRGLTQVAPDSVHAVTVPGAIEAWTTLHADHGSRDFAALLAPAIGYARDGYPLHPRVVFDWRRRIALLRQRPATRALFLDDGAVPPVGSLHRQPQLAQTLAAIAAGGRAAFYEGPIAAAMVRTLNAEGGVHTVDDFAATKGDYVTPLSTDYHGWTVHQQPPSNQGMAALLMLNLLRGFDLRGFDPLSAERTHLEIEAGRLALALRNAVIADPTAMTVDPRALLTPATADALRAHIRLDAAMPGIPDLGLGGGDTIYLCVVDRDRNAVSFINSLYQMFGSGILCPETGVLFQNRGWGFRVDPAHPNCIGPNKRPMHTIMPGMVTRGGKAVMAYGVMGADYQPFGHTRILTNLFDYDMDPQAALDLPRVFAMGNRVEVERSLPSATVAGLIRRGHAVAVAPAPWGGGQIIQIDHDAGVLAGGSDPRKDGCALGY